MSTSISNPERISATRPAGALLLHPLVLVSTLLLWLNDRFWKFEYQSWVTGKLSDVCGLLMFPLLLVSLAEALSPLVSRRFRAGPTAVGLAAALTAAVFVAIKLDIGAACAYQEFFVWRWKLTRWLLSQDVQHIRVTHVLDGTDLFALPVLLVPVWLARAGNRPG